MVDSELDPHRLDGLFRIGVDEVSWRTHHKYLTLVVDHDRGRVIWEAKGRDAKTLDASFDELAPDRSAQLSAVSMDWALPSSRASEPRAMPLRPSSVPIPSIWSSS